MLKNIPGKLSFYLVKKEFENQVILENSKNYHFCYISKNTGKVLYQIRPTEVKSALSGKTKYFSNPYNINDSYLEIVTIDNSDLRIGLNFEKTIYRACDSRFCMEIYHPDIDDRLFQPFIDIDSHTFLSLLSESGVNLINSKLTGTFKISIRNLGYYSNYSIVPEDSIEENPLLRLSVDYGLLRQTEYYTSNWIPGHIYCLYNRDIFIYLGPGKNVPSMNMNKWHNYSTVVTSLFNSSKLLSFWTGTVDSTEKEVKLVIPIVSDSQLNSAIPLKNRTLTIDDIVNYLVTSNNNAISSSSYYSCLGYYKTSKRPVRAMDLGEFITLKNVSDPSNIYPELISSITHHILNNKKKGECNMDELNILPDDILTRELNNCGKYKELVINKLLNEVNYALHTVKQKLIEKTGKSTISAEEVVLQINTVLNSEREKVSLPLSTYEYSCIKKAGEYINTFVNNFPIENFSFDDLYYYMNNNQTW